MNKWVSVLLVFVIALSIRLITLNKIGKTWDEGAYVEPGYNYTKLFLKGNFSDPSWYLYSDHPPFARYLYGAAAFLDPGNYEKGGKVIFNYNFTFPRVLSMLAGSLTAVIIVLLGYKYFSGYVGFASGVIFALIPFFVGLSQLATLESLILLTWTSCIFFVLENIKTKKKKYIFFAGIILGISILVKQSNIILIPFIASIYAINFMFQKKKNLKKFIRSKRVEVMMLGVWAFVAWIILWPMFFLHLGDVWEVQNRMWIHEVHLPPPEVFFGKLILVPFPYYFVMFILTTPLVLIVLSLLGVLKIDIKKTFIPIVILVWFLFPFLQSFYSFKQHGVRYIIEIYAPFALLCGIGLEYFNEKLKKIKYIRVISTSFVIIYLVLILYKISPYYLDYFGEVAGGNNYIFNNRLFQMGWWGQGISEAAEYINSHENKKVTVAVNGGQPASVMPKLKNIQLVYYDKNKSSDYVIVPYFDVVRIGFPEKELKEKYKVVYRVKIDKADLVRVYKKIGS